MNEAIKIERRKLPMISKCAVCGQIYKDHAGSTPCCGAVSYLADHSLLIQYSCDDVDQMISSTKSLFDIVAEVVTRAEEQIMLSVISAYIGHDPSSEDIKRVSIIRHQDVSDRFLLSIDDKVLGMIKFAEGDGINDKLELDYRIEFRPNEKDFQSVFSEKEQKEFREKDNQRQQ
ncbi:hypothetical protein [Bacteroides sp.]|uniref:hypothetical protein n=1 Tax=Bacteroides sp. TaxID=29523 RepID=UPI0026181216|nr:hypothetical protein [Bacteroides sp.]MDD3041015.1 hypothetical protein [Bacteroides sp.]